MPSNEENYGNDKNDFASIYNLLEMEEPSDNLKNTFASRNNLYIGIETFTLGLA